MRRVPSKDGTTIAFDQSGSGPAIILVGGALSERSAGASLAALLAPHFTVISYDRRGRGDSGDTEPYAVEREVEDIAALIEVAGGSAFVYGKSSGAALTLEAANRGLPMPKLALYEPPFIVDSSRPMIPSDYVEHLTALVAAGRRGDAVEYFMAKAVGVPAEMLSQMRQAPMWPAMEQMAPTLLYDDAVIGGNMAGKPFPPGQWAAVTMPTLVMDGGDSPTWMRNTARAVADALPNAQRRTLASQTHAVMPDVLAPILLEFFSGQ